MKITSIVLGAVRLRKIQWTVTALVISVPIAAQSQEIPRSVVGCGGDRLASDELVLQGTIGQAMVGEVSGPALLHQIGYWYQPGPPATPVHMVSLLAERSGNRVVVRWVVTSGSTSGGFHVWRQQPPQLRVRISEEPLIGSTHFEFVDPAAPAGDVEYWLQAVEDEDEWYGPVRLSARPLVFRLEQNRPNPFNPTTSLRYSLPEAASVRLLIYDIGGRLIRTLVNGDQPAGLYTIIWNGLDERGRAVASGTYFVHLASTAGSQIRKMVLAR